MCAETFAFSYSKWPFKGNGEACIGHTFSTRMMAGALRRACASCGSPEPCSAARHN